MNNKPKDLAPDVSIAAGRLEFRHARASLKIIQKLVKQGVNINDEYQLILVKKSKLSSAERNAIIEATINKQYDKSDESI